MRFLQYHKLWTAITVVVLVAAVALAYGISADFLGSDTSLSVGGGSVTDGLEIGEIAKG